jgi:hypothetical protein
MHSRTIACGLAAALFASMASSALRAEPPAALAQLQFLLGDWEAAGDQAGATGGSTFAANVQGHVIVRTNYSDAPASGGTPASRHDDLMVIYVEGNVVKADYFDNEGHVIRYAVSANADQVVFVSDIMSAEPRFRLTYTRTSPTTLKGRFEIAPPGKPDAFAPYLSWTAHKKKK